MLNSLCIIASLFLLCTIGCDRASSPRSPGSEATANLNDIGQPDKQQRKVDGILIIGSALTDEHVNAIRALTDDRQPDDPSAIRNIVHESPTEASNAWQLGTLQTYQKLRFANGQWAIFEDGGGFTQ